MAIIKKTKKKLKCKKNAKHSNKKNIKRKRKTFKKKKYYGGFIAPPPKQQVAFSPTNPKQKVETGCQNSYDCTNKQLQQNTQNTAAVSGNNGGKRKFKKILKY